MRPIASSPQRTPLSSATPAAADAAKQNSKLATAWNYAKNDPRPFDIAHQTASLTTTGSDRDILTAAVLLPGMPAFLAGASSARSAAKMQVQYSQELSAAIQAIKDKAIGILKERGVPPKDVAALKEKFETSKPVEIAQDALRLFDRATGGGSDASKFRRELEYELAQYGRAMELARISDVKNVSKPLAAVASDLAVFSKASAIVAAHAPGETLTDAFNTFLGPTTSAVQAVSSSVNAWEHMKEERLVEKDIQTLKAFDILRQEVRESMLQELSQRKRHKRHQISGDALIAAGKGTQTASAIPVGPTIALKAGALAATASGTVQKSIYEKKMARSEGPGASDAAKAHLDPAWSAKNLMVEKDLQAAVQWMEQEYHLAQDLAAESKLGLEIIRALQEESSTKEEISDPLRVQRDVEKRLNDRANHRKFANWRTTLVPADFKKAERLFKGSSENFLSGTKADVCSRIYHRLVESFLIASKVAQSESFKESVLTGFLKKLNTGLLKSMKKESSVAKEIRTGLKFSADKWEKLDQILGLDPKINNVFIKTRAKLLCKQLKEDGKYLRAECAKQILDLAAVHKLRQDLSAGRALESGRIQTSDVSLNAR